MGANKYPIMIIFCGLAMTIPFLVTNFPPITDLPQHVSQVRLFSESLTHPDSPYKINWITPYSLPYVLIGLSWLFFGPAKAGSVALLIMGLFFLSLLYYTARKRQRSLELVFLSSLFFFSHILYWGFYQFLLGWLIFILWFHFTTSPPNSVLKRAGLSFIMSGLLYFSHILWALVAALWLLLVSWAKKRLKENWPEFSGIFPFILLGIFWYPSLAAYGFKSETIWATTPLERLSFSWLADAALGGLRGSIESIILLFLLGWIVLALWQNRKQLRLSLDSDLLYAASLFLILALILPDKQTNTIRFGQRWIPPATVFFLLSLPAIKVTWHVARSIAFFIFIAFITVTSFSWKAFERYELSGLSSCLEKLPPQPKVLGLSFIKESDLVRGRPFIQTFAYAQVWHGGELNFSFADFGPSLVIYQKKRQLGWTPALEWFPELTKKSDLDYFDYVIVNGDENIHRVFASETRLSPLTTDGRWRLYQVKR